MKNKIVNFVQEKIEKLKIDYMKGYNRNEVKSIKEIKKIIIARNELLNLKLEETKDVLSILNILALYIKSNYELLLIFNLYTKLLDLIILNELTSESYILVLFKKLTYQLKDNVYNVNKIKINDEIKVLCFEIGVLLTEQHYAFEFN